MPDATQEEPAEGLTVVAGGAAPPCALSEDISAICKTQKETLPYSICPPTWTNNGLYSLNTRPGLGVHRRDYDKVPRLFPVRTHADQLCEPFPPFDATRFESEFHEPRLFSSHFTALHPDEPNCYLPTSPGLSDIDGYTSRKWKKRRIDDQKPRTDDPLLFDGEFPQIMQNAELALKQARYVQRDSWRRVGRRSSVPPVGVRDDLLDKWNNESIVLEAEMPPVESFDEPCDLDGFGSSTGNPVSVVRIGNENTLVCAMSGRLDSIAIYDVRTYADLNGDTAIRVFRRGQSVPSSEVVLRDMTPITDIVATDWEAGSSEPCTLLVSTRKSLNFANICTNNNQPTVDWVDRFSFPAALSCAANPLYPTEFAALSSEGLFFGSPQDWISRMDSGDDYFYDVQVLSRERVYNRVFFGLHPRSLLLSSHREIANFDIRRRVDKDSRNVLFDVRNHWNLPWHDSGIAIFKPLHPRSYMMFVATQTSINFFDLRMPHNPLLDWSMSLPLPVQQACITHFTTHGKRSEIIALASRKQWYLEVYHAVHDQSVTAFSPFPQQILDGKGRDEWKPPPAPKRPLLWSDLPLSHLEQLKETSHISGMALLPLNNGKQVSLVQWSAKEGLIGQLLEVRVGQEGEIDFEGLDVKQKTSLGTSVAMQDFRRRFLECGEYKDRLWMQRPVSDSMPGSVVHKRTRRLYLSDVRELRPCILRDDDDDQDEAGFVRLPRPFLANIPLVQEIRRRSGDKRMSSKRTGGSSEYGGESEQVTEGMEGKRGEIGDSSSNDEKYGPDTIDDQSQESSQPGAGGNSKGLGLETQASQNVKEQAVLDVTAVAGGADGSNVEASDERIGEEKGMSGLLKQIGSGMTLDEIGRVVRSGMAHNATPLGVQGLQGTVEGGPMVDSYDVEWHSLCVDDHVDCATAVSTNDAMADWVHTRVYYTEQVRAGEALEKSTIDEESGYGRLLLKMKGLFVEAEGDEARGSGSHSTPNV